MNTKTSGIAWHGVLLLGMAFSLACPTGPAVAAEPVGVVLSSAGQVDIQGPSRPEWQPVALKQEVFPDDVLRTGIGGRVQVLLNDDTLVNLGEESEVAIAEFVIEPERGLRNATLKLTRGVSRFIVGGNLPNPDSRLEVHTPTAVIGVRGTTFYVRVIPGAKSFVVASVNSVSVRNVLASVVCDEKRQRSEVLVRPNFATTVFEGLCPEVPRLATEKEFKELFEATRGPVWWSSGSGSQQAANAAGSMAQHELFSPDVVSSLGLDAFGADIQGDILETIFEDIIETVGDITSGVGTITDDILGPLGGRGGLPPGLAKREELPPGLDQKDELPPGLQ